MPTTSPHGIIYPDSSGIEDLEEHFEDLATSIETALTTYETWQSWTPTWAQGGFSSVGGSGQNQGHYIQIGSFVFAAFRIELAAGFVATAGIAAINLPVQAYSLWSVTNSVSTLGSWTARDDSATNHYSGSLAKSSSTGTAAFFDGAWNGTTNKGRVTETVPFTWAANDILSGSLTYRAA